ncbi:MAG: peptide ABC transporter ATP-binding protein, partial [Longimicrobiales bacterium]
MNEAMDRGSALPPAKGDSDTGGRTPDQLEAPADALLDVRDLRKHFPIHRGFLGRQVGAVR